MKYLYKLLLVAAITSTILSGCSVSYFPKNALNPLTIGQEAIGHTDMQYVSAGNHNEGTVHGLWRFNNATHQDSAVVWGYVMHVPSQKLFKNHWFVVADLSMQEYKPVADILNDTTGIIHQKLAAGTYDINIYPESLVYKGISLYDLTLSGGDSVCVVVMVPGLDKLEEKEGIAARQAFLDMVRYSPRNKKSMQKHYIQYYINGKQVRQKVTSHKHKDPKRIRNNK